MEMEKCYLLMVINIQESFLKVIFKVKEPINGKTNKYIKDSFIKELFKNRILY